MKKVAISVVGGAAAALAAPALAQDAPSFSGPRVEVLTGYDISKAGSSVDNDANRKDDESMEGVLFGIGAGYDVAVGGAVLGVEGEVSQGTAKGRFDSFDVEDFGLGRVKAGRDLYVGARAGVLVSPQTLLYAKAGYTNARYKVVGGDMGNSLRQAYDTDGWRVGAGAEVAVKRNVFAKLEYRYSNYSKAEVDFENEGIADSPRFDIDTDRHQVVAGLGVRF